MADEIDKDKMRIEATQQIAKKIENMGSSTALAIIMAWMRKSSDDKFADVNMREIISNAYQIVGVTIQIQIARDESMNKYFKDDEIIAICNSAVSIVTDDVMDLAKKFLEKEKSNE